MKIAVGLSGGVDSSVVAALLKKEGHDVIGITMKIWDESLKLDIKGGNACYGPDENEDIESCQRLAHSLNIPYHVLDLSKKYSKHILDYFTSEYEAGRTPNPCVKCNSVMKFGFLLSEAKKLGIDFDYFATGHYAQIEKIGDKHYIKKAVDINKDQSYFIHRLDSDILSKVMFPLGGMTKPIVRALAKQFHLEVAEKAESQDFIAGGDYKVLFDKTFGPGNIVNEEGQVLGKHNGIVNYTVGQRKGINVSSPVPLYVKEIDMLRNQIIVTTNEKLFDTEIHLSDVHIYDEVKHDSLFIKIRQNHEPVFVDVIARDNEKAVVHVSDPVRGITPGQSAVFYNEHDTVVGYGVLEK